MIKDITLGQFFPIESPIHKLDPRAKILSAIVYIFAIFFVNGYSGYVAVALFTYVIILMSKVPLKLILKSLKPLIFLLLFTSLINIFMTDGKIVTVFDVPLRLGFLKITYQGVDIAVDIEINRQKCQRHKGGDKGLIAHTGGDQSQKPAEEGGQSRGQ